MKYVELKQFSQLVSLFCKIKDLSCVLGFRRLFLILLAIVTCYHLKWSRNLVYQRPLILKRGKRGRNIFCVSWEDRQPLQISVRQVKKIALEINRFERENLEVFRDCGAKLQIIFSNFESKNSLDSKKKMAKKFYIENLDFISCLTIHIGNLLRRDRDYILKEVNHIFILIIPNNEGMLQYIRTN